MTATTARHGLTLIELIVAMAVLAIGFAVAGAEIMSPPAPGPSDSWRATLRATQAKAVERGTVFVAWPDSTGQEGPYLFLPDGRSVGPGAPALQDGAGPR